MVDKELFFEEAARRLCSSLEIENALWRYFRYIRKFIPSDLVFITHYDTAAKCLEVIVKADVRQGRIISNKIPIPVSMARIIDNLEHSLDAYPRVFNAERVVDHPYMGVFYPGMITDKDAACLSTTPNPEWKLFGNICLVNYSGKKFTKEHEYLFTLLKDPYAIAISNYLQHRGLLRLKNILADDNKYLQEELRQHYGAEIVGADLGLKNTMEMVRQVAPLASPVLLQGETGTGKEIIANAIHNLSTRKNGPFIKVNCGAIPETLMDSELFGHEKGAFTGAVSQKRGRFERAHGGTIFLDEIGELTMDAQIKILRTVQEKEIERIGGMKTIKVDIRLIAATHRDLKAMVFEGIFRKDLYYRLRVFPVLIPPLRDRRFDIPALVQHFIQKKGRELGMATIPDLKQGAIKNLTDYDWPGNVRELQNVIERALILNKGDSLDIDGLLENPVPPVSSMVNENFLGLDEIVSRQIMRALEMTAGRVGGEKGAARLLKINPSTLRSKMKKMKIPYGKNAG